MHCPSCNRPFSFLDSLRILNPRRCKCPSCAARLTTGHSGWIAVGAGCLIGISIAAVAIGMEEFQLWTSRESHIWFALSLPGACLPLQWFWWRRARLTLRP
jgi:hypothetical protein